MATGGRSSGLFKTPAQPPPPRPVVGVPVAGSDTEALLTGTVAEASPEPSRAARAPPVLLLCLGVCCCLLGPLPFAVLAVWAAASPVTQPVLNEFNFTSASDLIRNMPFPRTGPLPGIWWMDQYGVNLGAIPGNYSQYYLPVAAPEIFFTMDAAFAVPRAAPFYEECYYPVGSGGVSQNASWAFANTDGERGNPFQPLVATTAASKITGLPLCTSRNGSRITFLNRTDGIQYMDKTDWGWSRTSVFPVATEQPVLATVTFKFLSWFWPCIWGIPTPDFTRPFHYPVFQVVDESGMPTEHFQAALDFIGKRVPCKRSWLSWLGRVSPFLRPHVLGAGNFCNEGPGTLLWVPPMGTPPGPPCRPFCSQANQSGGGAASQGDPGAANTSRTGAANKSSTRQTSQR